MADMENGGMMSQAELDALIAASGAFGESDSEEMDFGGLAAASAAEMNGDALGEDELSETASDGLGLGAETSGRAPFAASGAASGPKPGGGALGMVDLPSFSPAPAAAPYGSDGGSGMGRVRDIPLEVTVELGRTRLLIRDILDLSAGSIIELDKIAGEPVDLFANGMLVARGEVIVIDDNFGVRVTEIITAGERSAEKESHARAA